MTTIPHFATLSEIKRFLFLTWQKQPKCRIGQALCNQHIVPKTLENMIYECNNLSVVATLIHQFQNGKATMGDRSEGSD